MKTLRLTIGILLFTGCSVFAQEYQMAVRFNLFSPVMRTFTGYIEKAIAEDKTLVLGLSVTDYKPAGSDKRWSGFHILPEYRFYLQEEAFDGFYLAPYFRYQSLVFTEPLIIPTGGGNYVNSTSQLQRTALGGGICIGQQKVLKNISLDAFVGPFYNTVSTRVLKGSPGSGNEIPFGEGITIRAGFAVGVAF